MRKWEWVKTILAAAAAMALMLFLGNQGAFYRWIETLIYIGILAGGFYGGYTGGLMAGGTGGLLLWYVAGGELLQVIGLMIGGVCCAFFSRLGKSAACMAFLSGTAILYLLFDVAFPTDLFKTLLVSLVVFLIVSPEKKHRKGKQLKHGPESALKVDLASAAAARRWKRLADSFTTLANSFDDQSLFIRSAEADDLSAVEWKQRFLESRQAIRLQFMQVGQVICEQQKQIEGWKDVTEKYRDKICRSLRHRRLICSQLLIMEDPEGRQEVFAGLSCRKGGHLSAQEAAGLIHTEAGKKFCPAYDCRSVISKRPEQLHFIERQHFKVLYGLSRKNREGEECSGDSFSARMLGEDRMLLCLSDGMGTGKKAGLESEMAIDLLEQLLDNGFTIAAAVSMINHILLNQRSRQTPTTLDICILDLYSGICRFVKMGASAGYLKRERSVSAIHGQALPLGMIPWEEMDQSMVPSEQLRSGDMLVMMTDGVSEKAGTASDEIIKELLSECTIRNAQEMAGWLMEQLLMLDETIRDDMTILVAGIWGK